MLLTLEVSSRIVSSRMIQVHLILLGQSMGLVHNICEKPSGALLATGVRCVPGVQSTTHIDIVGRNWRYYFQKRRKIQAAACSVPDKGSILHLRVLASYDAISDMGLFQLKFKAFTIEFAQSVVHLQGGCYQDGNLRILESILPFIILCKNLKIIIFLLISQT